MQSADALDGVAPSESELVHLARQGHEGALRTIVRLHHRRLYRMARAVVQNDYEAEDVVQETYVRALTNFARFRGDSSLMTWLSRIALNEAVGRRRRSRIVLDLAAIENQNLPNAQVVASLQPIDPERAVAQHQIGTILEQAIDELPEAFRRVLIARAIDDMTVKEAAEFLGLQPATIKTRLHRARSLLKEALDSQTGAGLTDAFPFDGYPHG